MSDTPISDSTAHNIADLGVLCRKMERELNAANAEIEEKRKDVVWLATEKAKIEGRIQRLEEAGDRLQMLIEEQGWWESVPQEMWRKAKDAK